MIYSKSHNFLFCHVPKTGGTSFRFALSPYRRRFEQSVVAKLFRKIPSLEYNNFLYDFTNRPHTTCQHAADLLGDKYNDLFAFCLMRKPTDWLYSSFLHLKRHSMKFASNELIEPSEITFKQYLCELIELGENKPSQSFMVVNNDGKLIVDSIGLFEALAEYYSYLKYRLDLNISDELPRLNSNRLRNDNGSQELVINQNDLDLISKYWDSDCALWDFVNQKSCKESLKTTQFTIKSPTINLAKYDPWRFMI